MISNEISGVTNVLTSEDSTKELVRSYWDAQPCGSSESSSNWGSAEFFEDHAKKRYEREPMIENFANFAEWVGQRVLEIGVGMGADHVRFRKAGANMLGVDISGQSLVLTSRRAAMEGLQVDLANADAEVLPFPDNSFDMVYSWGVLMHTPDVPRTIREVRRVLKPGGKCRVMLYNRHSLLALQIYLYYGLLRAKPLSRTRDLIRKHLESPGTKAFTTNEAKTLFKDFGEIEVKPVATVYDLRLGRRRFAPQWMLRLVPDRLGWFLLISARK
jgi:ubiquinone/menaquinone biosynthesis C-methylase UbiE